MKTAFSVFALVAVAASSTAQPQQVYPASGPGGNYEIVVIADGYTSAEEYKFTRAVNGLILNDLMADPFYGNSHAFTIVKQFNPVTTSGQSQFGITPNYNIAKCYIDYDAATTTAAIDQVVKTIPHHAVIVIGNYEGVAIGCTNQPWTWISAGAREVDGVLEHEFGHLIAGLYDEFPLQGNVDYPPTPSVDDHNCSNVFDSSGNATPWWDNSSLSWPQKPTDRDGCLYYSHKITRPYDTCLMYAPGATFCYVCSLLMSGELNLFANEALTKSLASPMILTAGFVAQTPTPRVPARGSEQYVRLLVQLTKRSTDPKLGAQLSVVSVADVTGPIVSRHHRTGDYVYGIVEGNTVLAADVLPGDPFQRRSLGTAPAPHDTANELQTNVVVIVPNTTRQSLLSRSIRVVFYRLDPNYGRLPSGMRADVTTNTISELLANNTPQFVGLDADELKKVVQSLPVRR